MKEIPVFELAETELKPGTSLVEASAGTGKTFTIAGLFLRLILERNLSVREILVVTYTVAATEELRHRIRQTLAGALRAFTTGTTSDPFLKAMVKKHGPRKDDLKARLDRALYGFDEAAIYTIHGFCQRVLKDRAFETGSLFDMELVTDQMPILRQLVEDYWRNHFYRAGRIPVLFATKNGLTPDSFLPFIRGSLSHPFLELISPVDNRDLEALAQDLEQVFESLREIWREDKDDIRAQFGSGVKWANKPYNDDEAMNESFRQVDSCLSAQEFAPSTLEALQVFKTTEIATKVSARAKKANVGAPKHRFFDLCDDLSRAEDHYLIGLKLQALRHVQQELPRRKAALKIQFFDDLLVRLHDALLRDNDKRLGEALRRQYAAALVDEFQDTDPLQYEIFKRVFAEPENYLFLIGDPKQAIYGFRGADIFTYLKATQQTDHYYTLKENWRSESGLVRAVNTLFSGNPQAFVFEGIQFLPVEARGAADENPARTEGETQPPFQIWFWRRESKEHTKGAAEKQLPAIIAAQAVELLNGQTTLGERRLLPEDIAVLVLENRQAQLIQDALTERRIPSVLYTTASLFASREVVELKRVLAAIAEPTDESLLKAALATDLMGLNAGQIEALILDEVAWQEKRERFRSYLGFWTERGFFQMFRKFLQREQVRPRLLAFTDGERRLTNLLHLSEVLHRASVESRLGVSGLLKWIGEQCEAEGQVNEEHQLRLETDEKAVKLVTVHKSKGLEYSVVLCPFFFKGAGIEYRGEEQVFFHEQAGGGLIRDLGSSEYEAHRQRARVERLAENIRLLYVALTRAKHRCYFVWGAFRDAATSAPAWLWHRPPDADPDPVEALEQHFPSLDDNALLQGLREFADKSTMDDGAPSMEVQDLPESSVGTAEITTPTGAPLDCRRFTGTIARDWRISSFTSLTANQGEELPDYDATGGGLHELPPSSGIHAFPAGAKAGSCLHKILEELDFAQWQQPATKDLVAKQLRAYGFSDVEHTDVVVEMLGRVMEVPLGEKAEGRTLSRIELTHRLNELEFYFPLQRISAPPLQTLLRRHGIAATLPEGGAEPGGFSFAPVTGMLKGFIDLVFEFQGRFFIVDWKSNWLGRRTEDYSAAALQAEIRHRHYYFQYQLYTVALDRYLRLRLPGYRYDQHFGGVYYLFLRGIDPARPEFGVHHDRPEEGFLRELDSLLTGKDGERGNGHE